MELGANLAAFGRERSQLSAREAESEKASRLAARQTLDAQKALKANQERERSAQIAERKALASEQRLAEAKKAKDELGTRELEEARKLLQVRDRKIADQEKEVQRLQASLRSASGARAKRLTRPFANGTRNSPCGTNGWSTGRTLWMRSLRSAIKSSESALIL